MLENFFASEKPKDEDEDDLLTPRDDPATLEAQQANLLNSPSSAGGLTPSPIHDAIVKAFNPVWAKVRLGIAVQYVCTHRVRSVGWD